MDSEENMDSEDESQDTKIYSESDEDLIDSLANMLNYEKAFLVD